MRISNAQISAMMHSTMNNGSQAVAKLAQQMGTGLRILRPSDDPIASVRILRIQREEAGLAQYNKNIANVSGSLSIQETNLKSASDSMLSVRDQLLWASNGANTAEDLAAIAGELESLEKTILGFANARDAEGHYLLSGTLSDTPAITYDPETQRYVTSGNDQHRQAAVANGVLIDGNVTAQEVFGQDADLLNDLHELVAMLKDPALDPANPAVEQKLKDTLGQLDDTHGKLLGAITDMGGRQNTLTLLGESNEDISLANKKIEGDLSQLDFAGATIELASYQLSMQASQKVYLKISNLSLFNML